MACVTQWMFFIKNHRKLTPQRRLACLFAVTASTYIHSKITAYVNVVFVCLWPVYTRLYECEAIACLMFALHYGIGVCSHVWQCACFTLTTRVAACLHNSNLSTYFANTLSFNIRSKAPYMCLHLCDKLVPSQNVVLCYTRILTFQRFRVCYCSAQFLLISLCVEIEKGIYFSVWMLP